MSTILDFKPIDKEAMDVIWPYLLLQTERTCDFSYGGILMWVEYFNYEYAIYRDTLFIRGRSVTADTSDIGRSAFSVPVGAMSVVESLALLRDFCGECGMPLEFSAVPREAAAELSVLGPSRVVELPAWADYLYDAVALAELKGKKYNKKRNHLHQFMAAKPSWRYESLTAAHVPLIHAVTERTIANESSQSESAKEERKLAAQFLAEIVQNNNHLLGGVLCCDDEIVAYTVGDIKLDTLYVHIEKAERSVPGSFEMINKCFAEDVITRYPEVKYINREDDAGVLGLRLAKESYHPCDLLMKYNIVF